MATYEDFLRAAANAQKAGDISARDRLLGQASKMRGQATTAPTDQGYALPFDPVTGATGPATPPAVIGVSAGDLPFRDSYNPDRLGDTFFKMIEAPKEATKHYASQVVAPDRSPLQRLGDAGMTALGARGTVSAGVSGAIGEAFGGDQFGEMRLARDLAAAQEVAIPELAGFSSVQRVAGSAGKKIIKTDGPSLTEKAAQAAHDLRITPSLSMSGKAGAMASAFLEKTVLTGARLGRDTARAAAEIEGAAHRITGMIGKADGPYGAGTALQAGLRDHVQRVKARSGQMYAAVAKEIPPDTRMSLDITHTSMASLKEAFKDNPELAQKLGLNQWDAVLKEAGKNGISWDAATQFRSSVGEAIGSLSGPLADQSQGRLKALYGSLTADMERTAKASGTKAYQAWERANTYYKRSAERIEKQLDGTISAKSPERAFELFYSAALGDRSSSDLGRLTAIKASLKPGEWRDVSASIVDRLGKATPGQQGAAGDTFSPATFLTNWNKMAPDARRILLPEDARTELEKLMSVAEAAKRGGLERNTSNTGSIVTGVALANAGFAAPITTALASGALTLSARGLTDPWFLRALNDAQRGNPKAIAAMAAGNGPFKADASEVVRLLAAHSASGQAEQKEGAQLLRSTSPIEAMRSAAGR